MEASMFPCVGEVMSAPVVVVRDYDSSRLAIDRFVVTGLHHLVVLDKGDQLVGILDDRQALALWLFDAAGMHRHTIGELVRHRVADTRGTAATVGPDAALRLAGRLMLEQGVDALAVVDDLGRVLGILTFSDLIGRFVAEPERLTVSDSPQSAPAPIAPTRG